MTRSTTTRCGPTSSARLGWAQARGLDFDRELFFVAAMLHDLALTPPFDSHTLAFEEAGGHLARVSAGRPSDATGQPS